MALQYPKLILARYPAVSDKQKINIYVGDSFAVLYEIRQLNPNNKMQPEGVPADPLTAFVRCKNDSSDELFLLTGTEAEAPMLVELATADRGAYISYTLPPTFTDTPGNYELFVTATFADGDVVTQNRRFTVKAFVT